MVRVAFAVCLLGMLAFAHAMRGQQDPATGKSTTGAPPEEDVSAAAQEESENAVHNPVASLTSIPLHNNTNSSLGSFNQKQDVLNIQPVIPVNLNRRALPQKVNRQ